MLIQVLLKKSLKYKITCIENDWKRIFFFNAEDEIGCERV